MHLSSICDELLLDKLNRSEESPGVHLIDFKSWKQPVIPSISDHLKRKIMTSVLVDVSLGTP